MPATESLHARIARRLQQLEDEGLTRRRRPPSGIDLSSNDYLGLANHPAIRKRMAEAVLAEGCGSTGSRLLRGERETFAAIERRFAEFKRSEAALYFGSGYAANVGALSAFLEEGDVVFSDEFNHASLIDGIRLAKAQRVIFRHRDLDQLRTLLASRECTGQKFLVTESLFSMDGDFAPLREYAAVCRETDTVLIVDEAHAVGIYGPRGSGFIEASGIEKDVFLSINTAGKALGVCGAFVCGATAAIDYLGQRARTFVFSTAPPPAVAAALDEALNVIVSEPERRVRVLGNASLLRSLLQNKGLPLVLGESQIFGIVLGANERAASVAAALQEEGFDVRAIRPPTVAEGTARLRVSVNADLDAQVLLSFADSLVRHAACVVAC